MIVRTCARIRQAISSLTCAAYENQSLMDDDGIENERLLTKQNTKREKNRTPFNDDK